MHLGNNVYLDVFTSLNLADLVLMRNVHMEIKVDKLLAKTTFLSVLLFLLMFRMNFRVLNRFVATADVKDDFSADYDQKFGVGNFTNIIWVPDDHTSIQEAINAASPGDTVYVKAGTYYEHVEINKTVSLIGENLENTILDGEGKITPIVRILAPYVTFCNFTVRNTASDQPAYGISVIAYNVTIINSIVKETYFGILLDNSSYCKVLTNTILKNFAYGIVLRSNASYNLFTGNNIMENPTGIWLTEVSCQNNTFYHNNFVENKNQICTFGTHTSWDNGTRGNYWSDYTGLDADGDGIGDTPYQDVDRFPLMEPVRSIPPIARFSYSSELLFVNKPITFNSSESHDLDGYINLYFWNFGDGTTESHTNKTDTIEHTYANAGTYTVNLTVTDNDGLTASITKTLIVQKMNSSIVIRVVPSTVTVGDNVSISGYITPKKVGVDVTIYHMFWPFETWKKLVAIKTEEPEGNYTYVWTTTQASAYVYLKANWTGDDGTFGSQSVFKKITVEKALSVITVNVDPQNVTSGSNVTISGTIDPKRVNLTISIQIYSVNQSKFVWNATVKTTADGLYEYVWKTSEIGTYEIKVKWNGDEKTRSAESEIKIVKVEAPPPPQDILPYAIAAMVIIIVALAVSVNFIKKKSHHPHHTSLHRCVV